MYNIHIKKTILPIIFIILPLIVIIGITFFNPKRETPKKPEEKIVEQLPENPVRSYAGWIKYYNSNLGLELFYPPQFKNYQSGNLTSKVRSGEKGGMDICINLIDCQAARISQFEIRSTTVDWIRFKTNPTFTDLQGYTLDGDIYTVKLNSGEYLALENTQAYEITHPSFDKVLIVPGLDGDQVGILYPPAGWIGAIINTGFSDYPGLIVQMQLTTDLTEELFKNIIFSFNFPWRHYFPDDSQILSEATPPRFYDSVIKDDIAKVAKIIMCRYKILGHYPDDYFPDKLCGKSITITNALTQKPYYYTTTNEGQGFIIKAKLSNNQIYSVTQADFLPTPTITPKPTEP